MMLLNILPYDILNDIIKYLSLIDIVSLHRAIKNNIILRNRLYINDSLIKLYILCHGYTKNDISIMQGRHQQQPYNTYLIWKFLLLTDLKYKNIWELYYCNDSLMYCVSKDLPDIFLVTSPSSSPSTKNVNDTICICRKNLLQQNNENILTCHHKINWKRIVKTLFYNERIVKPLQSIYIFIRNNHKKFIINKSIPSPSPTQCYLYCSECSIDLYIKCKYIKLWINNDDVVYKNNIFCTLLCLSRFIYKNGISCYNLCCTNKKSKSNDITILRDYYSSSITNLYQLSHHCNDNTNIYSSYIFKNISLIDIFRQRFYIVYNPWMNISSCVNTNKYTPSSSSTKKTTYNSNYNLSKNQLGYNKLNNKISYYCSITCKEMGEYNTNYSDIINKNMLCYSCNNNMSQWPYNWFGYPIYNTNNTNINKDIQYITFCSNSCSLRYYRSTLQ